jgi:hypothetical protein
LFQESSILTIWQKHPEFNRFLWTNSRLAKIYNIQWPCLPTWETALTDSISSNNTQKSLIRSEQLPYSPYFSCSSKGSTKTMKSTNPITTTTITPKDHKKIEFQESSPSEADSIKPKITKNLSASLQLLTPELYALLKLWTSDHHYFLVFFIFLYLFLLKSIHILKFKKITKKINYW